MLFGRKMTYIIRKKNSPYFVRSMTPLVDPNFEHQRWKVIFTDVKDLIELKIKGKKEALEKLTQLKETFPKEQMEFEIEPYGKK